jgi:hypothetical protein
VALERDGRVRGELVAHGPMREPTYAHVARAFLALADEPDPPRSPSPARVLCAVVVAVMLAVAAPLSWVAGERVEQPAATASKKGLPGADDDEAA